MKLPQKSQKMGKEKVEQGIFQDMLITNWPKRFSIKTIKYQKGNTYANTPAPRNPGNLHTQKNKLAKLGDAIAISKSETMKH